MTKLCMSKSRKISWKRYQQNQLEMFLTMYLIKTLSDYQIINWVDHAENFLKLFRKKKTKKKNTMFQIARKRYWNCLGMNRRMKYKSILTWCERQRRTMKEENDTSTHQCLWCLLYVWSCHGNWKTFVQWNQLEQNTLKWKISWRYLKIMTKMDPFTGRLKFHHP